MTEPSLLIEKHDAGDFCQVVMTGAISEDADLTPLESLFGRVELNLRGVRAFNSVGTRHWVDTMRRLGGRAQLIFVECSPVVVAQLNMISGFLAHGTVKSFYAPMHCDRCDREVEHLFSTAECRDLDRLPPVACTACGERMVLDEMEDRYLLFIREPTQVG